MRAFLVPKFREIHDQSLDITCMSLPPGGGAHSRALKAEKS